MLPILNTQWTQFEPYTTVNGIKIIYYPISFNGAPFITIREGGIVAYDNAQIPIEVMYDNTGSLIDSLYDPKSQTAFKPWHIASNGHGTNLFEVGICPEAGCRCAAFGF